MSGGGHPLSPPDLKPDPDSMIMNFAQKNYGSPESVRSNSPVQNSAYPPNHPLSGSKHFCSICGDRASGKHYGVFSCEGCKGFFKRTVRKELTYACRETRNCIIDKRQRNRCQYCRYMKCLEMGMRREAVQEERNRAPGSAQKDQTAENESSWSTNDMPMDRIVEAETTAETIFMDPMWSAKHFREASCSVRGKMVHQLLEWAKQVPHFSELKRDDQIRLIRFSWNELLISGYAYRSLNLPEDSGVLMPDGVITSEGAHMAGVGEIFDRINVELIGKMRELGMEKGELGCLRAIVLFNPDAKGLDSSTSCQVETFREMVYSTLEEHCRANYVDEPSRFAKLLLRLPALRSIGLKCAEHTFFYRLIKEDRPTFANADLRALDGGTGIYDQRNPLDSFMHAILDDM